MANLPHQVIYCPNPVHAQEKNLNGDPVKKILLIVKNSKIYIQCRDSVCRRTSGSNGWYEVEITGLGAVKARAMPKNYKFDLEELPVAVSEQLTEEQ